jgi:hypothetical protein
MAFPEPLQVFVNASAQGHPFEDGIDLAHTFFVFLGDTGRLQDSLKGRASRIIPLWDLIVHSVFLHSLSTG